MLGDAAPFQVVRSQTGVWDREKRTVTATKTGTLTYIVTNEAGVVTNRRVNTVNETQQWWHDEVQGLDQTHVILEGDLETLVDSSDRTFNGELTVNSTNDWKQTIPRQDDRTVTVTGTTTYNGSDKSEVTYFNGLFAFGERHNPWSSTADWKSVVDTVVDLAIPNEQEGSQTGKTTYTYTNNAGYGKQDQTAAGGEWGTVYQEYRSNPQSKTEFVNETSRTVYIKLPGESAGGPPPMVRVGQLFTYTRETGFNRTYANVGGKTGPAGTQDRTVGTEADLLRITSYNSDWANNGMTVHTDGSGTYHQSDKNQETFETRNEVERKVAFEYKQSKDSNYHDAGRSTTSTGWSENKADGTNSYLSSRIGSPTSWTAASKDFGWSRGWTASDQDPTGHWADPVTIGSPDVVTTSNAMEPVTNLWPKATWDVLSNNWVGQNFTNIVRVVGGATEVVIGLGTSELGVGVALIVLGADNIVAGVRGMALGRNVRSGAEEVVYQATGSQTAAILIPAAASLGLSWWGTAARMGGGVVAHAGQTQLSTLSIISRTALSPVAKFIGQATWLPRRQGQSLTLGVRASRVFITATVSYAPIGKAPIARFIVGLPGLRNIRWEQSHIFLQQRWWRIGGPTQWYPSPKQISACVG
jgi:hypothetical protein